MTFFKPYITSNDDTVKKRTIMESYSVFHYTVLFGAPDTHSACLWVTVLAHAQLKHLLWPCHSHWGMKLRWWHLDITAINTVNCISGLRFLLSFNINLIGIYLKENPLLVPLFTALFSGLWFSGCFSFCLFIYLLVVVVFPKMMTW